MPDHYFRVIAGTLVVKGYEPDGDSLRFIADNPGLYNGLRNERKARPGKDVSLQLRFEGIDAPELHYGAVAQPYGDTARDVLMKAIGFQNSYSGTKVLSSTPAKVPAHILTKAFDPHGRPISYVFCGPAAGQLKSGAVIRAHDKLIAASLNAQMITKGAAYALLYTSTPPEHRTWLTAHAKAAREEGLGLWPQDSTATFKLVDDASVTPPHGALIFPKFFRRCVDGLKAGFANLGDWLRATPQENDLVVYQNVEIHMSELFVQQNARLTVQADPLDLVFIEK